MRQSFKKCVLATLLTTTALTTGCYGPFQLTKNLHGWNGSINNNWGREGVFLGLIYIPVYPICILGDALIFNSIVFWGGTNPITAKGQPSTELDSVAASYGLRANLNGMPVSLSR